jgi:hypothetical protein
LVCPSGCGGKGSCDWNAEIPKCIFDIETDLVVDEDEGGMYISEAYISVISMYITVFVHFFTILVIV